MGTVAAAAAIVVAEIGADDPLDVAVVAVKLVAKLVVVPVELIAVEGPAVEGGEGVRTGRTCSRAVGSSEASRGGACPWLRLSLSWH